MDPFKERPDEKPDMQLILEQSTTEKTTDSRKKYNRIAARVGHTLLSVLVLAGICFNPNSSIYRAVASGTHTLEIYILPALVISTFVTYYIASLMNPGYVPISAVEENSEEDTTTLIKSDHAFYCRWCDQSQPLRSKHCRDCDRCVRRFDHHCPWLGNCVGERNHRMFIFFLMFEDILIFKCIGMVWQTSRSSAVVVEWMQYNGILVICGIVLFIGGLAVTALACCHLYLILHGLTTWEHVSHGRITYLKRWPEDTTPFNFGYCKNCFMFCCYCNTQNWEKYLKSLT